MDGVYIFSIAIRWVIIVLSILVILMQSVWTMRNFNYMAGSQFMKSFTLIGFAASGAYGCLESMYLEIPIGIRTYILLCATLWGFIALMLPDRYQQKFPADANKIKPPEEKK